MNKIFYNLKTNKNIQLLIVSDEKQAHIAKDCATYLGLQPFVLSDLRANFGDDLLSFSEEIKELTSTLQEYHEYKKQNKLLISPLRTISYALPKENCFETLVIEFASQIDLEALKNKLYNWGYYFVDIVSQEGEVSIRGDIIDIFPPHHEYGYRISLFDTEIESIRKFDVENQKSFKEELESITISASFLALDNFNQEIINEKIEASGIDVFEKDIHSLGFWFLDDLATYYSQQLNSYITKEALDEIEEAYIFDQKRIPKEQLLSLDSLLNDGGYKTVDVVNIHEFLEFHKEKICTIISSTEAKIRAYDFDLNASNINYKIDYQVINLISNDEVILSLNKQVKKKRKKKPKIVLDELQKGDYVVHEIHGIGQFEAIEPITVMGAKRDFVVLLYANNDKLLIPVENIGLVDRYLADSGTIAVLDRLGKGSFAKLKGKVKDKLFEIANDIIAIAAKRELTEGIYIDTSKEELALFSKQAGFEYTKDQTRSVKEIFSDLSSGLVMDRLLSGDVGFGKTEVAMNALLAVILNKYQALFVCPTTLLANQHFEGIKKRLQPFGVKVAKLDGKTNAKEKSSIKKALEDGKIDLVIGTHTLLGVKCANLALVVIDEEHKFGVKQKEKLKELRNDVHIFSMSATPIPRTLNLALSKVKGMSTLLTPPSERLGVRSFVKEYDEKLIKEIMLREKRRGGQLFYIYNNIATIETKKKDLLEILPNLKIAILHSQVTPKQSEEILEEFSSGNIDVLLATSIVESGLHLPNANSIIIDGADRFGIADLHQLRGRVGRSNKEGFCYFLVEDKKTITKDAIRRLIALESNSYLGSGTALAHQDLEIRGGGNIIGEAQSGHIKQIGYSLYLKMLEEAIAVLSGEVQKETQSVDIKLSITAFISSDYISEDRIRLELYRRLSKASHKAEVFEIQDEMEDRFGKMDLPSRQFIELILIKIGALEKNIKTISNYEMNISFIYDDDKKDVIKSPSRDDDDLIKTTMQYLTKGK
ncbi:MAG: transcription-repair coupling factor [Campylobacterales bacterium]|nr:transcription-repair coupling factor [Campylobacterales bacterium]